MTKSSQWAPTLHHGDGQFLCISSAVKTKIFLVAGVMFETVYKEKTHQENSYIFSVLRADLNHHQLVLA